MATMKKRKYEKQFVQILNETAKAVEEKNNPNPISLEALGLLVNLWSYDVETWDLHKTELYKRYAKNKKTSVSSAWSELVKAKYIHEFKFRNGSKWEYVYFYRPEPFTDFEIEEMEQETVEEYGLDSTSDFQQLKFNSSKSTVQNVHISNTKSKQDSINEKQTKEKQTKKIIDDEQEPFEVNKISFKKFRQEFKENFPDLFDDKTFYFIYEQMYKQELAVITYQEAVNQARYMRKRIDEGKLEIGDYAAYFVGGIKKKRTSERIALDNEMIAKAEIELKEKKEREEQERKKREIPAFYNWLEN